MSRRSDGTRLLFDFQRPVPRTAGTIGMWNGVLRVLARLAMVTNGLVVLVTMHGMEAHNRYEIRVLVSQDRVFFDQILKYVSTVESAHFFVCLIINHTVFFKFPYFMPFVKVVYSHKPQTGVRITWSQPKWFGVSLLSCFSSHAIPQKHMLSRYGVRCFTSFFFRALALYTYPHQRYFFCEHQHYEQDRTTSTSTLLLLIVKREATPESKS
jgi:hypothetical protein